MPSDNIVRKTHVTRLPGTNKNGDRLDDLYVDLERIDVMVITTQMPFKVPNNPNSEIETQWQEIELRFHWRDDPDNPDDFPGTPTRTTETLKLYDVETYGLTDDPDEWIPVEVIKVASVVGNAEGGDAYGVVEIAKRFLNSAIKADNSGNPADRDVQQRRFTHYDTNIDDAAQAAFDADPTRMAYVLSDATTYSRTDGTRDDGQYIETEVLERIHRQDSYDWTRTNGTEVEVVLKLDNEYLISESDPAKLNDVGDGGFNPPFRLDPFQNIINISWGGLAVKFLDGAA